MLFDCIDKECVKLSNNYGAYIKHRTTIKNEYYKNISVNDGKHADSYVD